MSQFIFGVRGEQKTLAMALVDTLRRGDLGTLVESALNRKLRDLALPKEEADVDPEALAHLLQAEMVHDVMLAIQGYTDWLASKLWRSSLKSGGPRKTEPLPECDSQARAAIVEKYPVDGSLLTLVINTVIQNQYHLPIIGVVRNDSILVDQDNLALWARHFDWQS